MKEKENLMSKLSDVIKSKRIFAPKEAYMDHVEIILVGDGPFVLFDSGYGTQRDEVVNWVKKESKGELEKFILTHQHHDHSGNAMAICDVMSIPCHAHPIEINLMKERELDLSVIPIQEGFVVNVGEIKLEAIFTPGHSPGHLAFWWKEEKVLIGGDNILTETTTAVVPPLGNLTEYIQSLKKVLDLKPRLIFPGHGYPIENPIKRIDYLLSHRDKREKQVLRALIKNDSTLEELAKSIYRNLREDQLVFGVNMIKSIIEKLKEEQKITYRKGIYEIL
ncbi:MAG: MBL fold metallo-hydrolase [Nitrospinota bacterium]|nr:MBL fold metallo-hydrolase [Nitrospinota bacterium]